MKRSLHEKHESELEKAASAAEEISETDTIKRARKRIILGPDSSQSSMPPSYCGIENSNRYYEFRYMPATKYTTCKKEKRSDKEIALEAKSLRTNNLRKEPEYIEIDGKQEGVFIMRYFSRDINDDKDFEIPGMRKVFFLTIYEENGKKRVVCRQYFGKTYEAESLEKAQRLILANIGGELKKARKKAKNKKKK